MQFEDRPQRPLTTTRIALVAVGGVLFVAQLIAAALLAPPTTGPGDASLGTFVILWVASILVATTITLCIIRQADVADVFTAALLATITPYALYALVAALELRGTPDETDVVSAVFLGVTTGALTGVLVWAIAMVVARLLGLPTNGADDASSDDGDAP